MAAAILKGCVRRALWAPVPTGIGCDGDEQRERWAGTAFGAAGDGRRDIKRCASRASVATDVGA